MDRHDIEACVQVGYGVSLGLAQSKIGAIQGPTPGANFEIWSLGCGIRGAESW